jgi:hypothetical protein
MVETPAVLVRADGEIIVLDAGSGFACSACFG